MEISIRQFAIGCVAASAFAVSAHAHAQIFKSTDREGRVTFSDVPVQGAVNVQRIATSDGAKPGVGEAGNGPQYLALLDGYDEMVRLANAKVDLAERALAEARRSIVGSHDPLVLAGGPQPSDADRQRIEFYKRDVATARRNLARILQQRVMLQPRPVA